MCFTIKSIKIILTPDAFVSAHRIFLCFVSGGHFLMEEIEEGKKKIEESLCKAHVHAHIQSKNYHNITCIL